MNYRFRTKDSPDANGRQPQAGEQKWTVYFPTEDGGRVYVEMGKVGRDAMLAMLSQEDADDAAEIAGSHKHAWMVTGTALANNSIEVSCSCGATGSIGDHSRDEWQRAFYAPSASYLWIESARVTVHVGE